MTCLSILHVSDVHFGCDDELGEQGTITKALIRVAHRDAKLIRTPDICIFSGDLSQNGTLEQLAAGEKWLTELVRPWGCPLFVVPGNHEVNRPEKGHELMRQMKARLVTASTEQKNYMEQREGIGKAECLTQFFAWHKAAKSLSSKVASNWDESNNFATSHMLRIDDLIVHFIGLNTAIASCSDEDKGKLVADIKALNELLECTNSETDLIIVVGHHPIQIKGFGPRSNERWLAKWNNDLLAERLLQEHGPHIYLHGHVHQLAGSALANNMGQQLVIFGAGASYQGSKYKQKFAFYEIDLKKREIRPSTLSYSTGDWVQSPAESRAMSLPLSFPNIVAKSTNIGPTIPRPTSPSVSGVDANSQLLIKAYDHTLRSIKCLVNNLYPINPGKKGTLRHYFSDIKHATVIYNNGDGVVTSTFMIVAGRQPVHFWTTWIRVEEDSPSISNFMGMNLEILDITKDSEYKVAYLPARDDGHDKEISVFFLPHIPPGGRRTVQVSFRWPGYVKRLFEGFTVEFAYGYPTGFPTKTTSVELSVEFPRNLGKVDCANKSIGDESATLKIENLGSGKTRWVYSNRRALLAKGNIILYFDRAKKKEVTSSATQATTRTGHHKNLHKFILAKNK